MLSPEAQEQAPASTTVCVGGKVTMHHIVAFPKKTTWEGGTIDGLQVWELVVLVMLWWSIHRSYPVHADEQHDEKAAREVVFLCQSHDIDRGLTPTQVVSHLIPHAVKLASRGVVSVRSTSANVHV